MSAASDPDGPEEFEGTLMDGLENEPPYPPAASACECRKGAIALDCNRAGHTRPAQHTEKP